MAVYTFASNANRVFMSNANRVNNRVYCQVMPGGCSIFKMIFLLDVGWERRERRSWWEGKRV